MINRFSMPHFPDTVIRQRLFSLLKAHAGTQNILITGQAAQGKSTLAASYLKQTDTPVIWLSLTHDDNDHLKLYDHIDTAVRHLLKERDLPESTLLSGGILGTEKGVLRYVQALSLLLNELPLNLCVVLDDFEMMDPQSTGFELISSMIENRFPLLQLFILTRTLPPFNMGRLKMARHIFELNNDDLSFNLEETQAFFSGSNAVPVEQIKKIQSITGGWAGGLTLLSEAFRHFKHIEHIPDRLNADLFNYFSQEIYDALPVAIREFLVQTAILDEINLDVVPRMFDPPDSSADALSILSELEKRNLFIQRIDSDHQKPRFRYHRLFKEFLIQDLIKSRGQEKYRSLNRCAGRILWEMNDHEAAMDCFIRADAHTDMIRIIKAKGTDYIITGKVAELARWIKTLDSEIIDADPWLIFFSTLARRIKGGRKNMLRFEQALSLFEKDGDTKGILLSIGYLIEAAVFIRQPTKVIIQWIDKGEQYLMNLQSMERYPWARALLLQQIGLGYIAGYGNLPKGVSACRNAILMARQIDNPGLILNASITMTFGYVQTGDFGNARQMLKRISQMTREGQNPEYRALKSIVDINFALKNARFDDTRQLLDQSEADIETFGLIFLYPGFIEAKALFFVYTGQYDDACQMADHLSDFSTLEGNDFYQGISARIRALSHFREGILDEALAEIEKALKEFDPSKKGDIHHFLTRQLGAMILYESGRLQEARQELVEVLDYFEQAAYELNHVETCLALGLILYDLKDTINALKYLKLGFERANAGRYTFFPMLSQSIQVQSLVLFFFLEPDETFTTHLLPLVSQSPPALLGEKISLFLGGLKKQEKNRAIDRLKPVYKILLPKLNILTLGQFNLALDRQMLDKSRFDGKKPLMLLKSLVIRGVNDVPKEVLIDDLWPHANPAAGEKNFKINLHRLRKALEPNPDKHFGYSYLIQKAGLVSLDPDLVSIDSSQFLEFSAQARDLEKKGRFGPALDLLDRALSMYQGDFFSEDLYMESLTQKRMMFRSLYMELLQKKARLHEEMDQMESAIATWKRLMDEDPYSEAGCQNLMILLTDCGDRQAAIDLFEHYRQLVKRDLGTDPDEQTLAVYQQVNRSSGRST
ncbi:MAG: protein MalT [Desulfobacteraceae bacterium]|nr:MAG: protein MalT [Desulfobacteraceae bacterium]